MLHLILLLVVLTLALTLIQRELLSRLLVNAFRDITGIHNKTSLENKSLSSENFQAPGADAAPAGKSGS